MEALSSVVKVTRPREVASRSLHESFNKEPLFFQAKVQQYVKKYVSKNYYNLMEITWNIKCDSDWGTVLLSETQSISNSVDPQIIENRSRIEYLSSKLNNNKNC